MLFKRRGRRSRATQSNDSGSTVFVGGGATQRRCASDVVDNDQGSLPSARHPSFPLLIGETEKAAAAAALSSSPKGGIRGWAVLTNHRLVFIRNPKPTARRRPLHLDSNDEAVTSTTTAAAATTSQGDGSSSTPDQSLSRNDGGVAAADALQTNHHDGFVDGNSLDDDNAGATATAADDSGQAGYGSVVERRATVALKVVLGGHVGPWGAVLVCKDCRTVMFSLVEKGSGSATSFAEALVDGLVAPITSTLAFAALVASTSPSLSSSSLIAGASYGSGVGGESPSKTSQSEGARTPPTSTSSSPLPSPHSPKAWNVHAPAAEARRLSAELSAATAAAAILTAAATSDQLSEGGEGEDQLIQNRSAVQVATAASRRPARERRSNGSGASCNTSRPQLCCRVSSINANYELCSTYPAQLMMPSTFPSAKDALLFDVTHEWIGGRLPILSWVHPTRGTPLFRASWPSQKPASWAEMLERAGGVLSGEGADVVSSVVIIGPWDLVGGAGERDTGQSSSDDGGAASADGGRQVELSIVGARGSTTGASASALAAMLKGIHQDCWGPEDVADMGETSRAVGDNDGEGRGDRGASEAQADCVSVWQSGCEAWIEFVRASLDCAVAVVERIGDGKGTLVCCPTGRDQSALAVSLALLSSDPHHRTIEGFLQLIDKEWVSMGHPFLTRHRHQAGSREVTYLRRRGRRRSHARRWRSKGRIAAEHGAGEGGGSAIQVIKWACEEGFAPMFLGFLDSVWQLMRCHPGAFEFNEAMLLYLADASFACEFGNFIFDSEKDRVESYAHQTTASVWVQIAERRNEFEAGKFSLSTSPLSLPAPQDVVLWSSFFERYWRHHSHDVTEDDPS